MNKFVKLLLIFVFTSVLAISSYAMAEKAPVKADPSIKKTAIDFSLPNLSGKSTKLSEYKNKVVFLNFFATWCPPCRAEMPSMQKLYEKLKNTNFEIIAVAMDKSGKSAVEPFITGGKYTFKVLLDESSAVADKYGIISIPTTFIIDKRGSVVSKTIGSRDWSDESTLIMFKKLINQ